MTEKHSPLPWEFDAGIIPPDGPGTYCDVYIDGGETIIARVNDCIPEGHANAAMIVRAVNGLPEAIAALEPFAKAAREFTSAIAPDGIDDGMTLTIAMPNGREAIMSTADFSRAAAALTKLKG